MLALHLLEEGGEAGGIGWMVWIALAVFFLMVFLGWWVSKNGLLKKEEEPVHAGHDEHGHGGHQHAEEAGHGHAAETHAGPDDLTHLEGVGPKVAKLLNGMGVHTFADLANVDQTRLRKALDDAGYKYMEPAGWIEQAALAAKGDMEGLRKLQSELKGGRRSK